MRFPDNEVTGAKAGGVHPLQIRALRAARVAQSFPWAITLIVFLTFVAGESFAEPMATNNPAERRTVAFSNFESAAITVVCELRYYLVGHVTSLTPTNRLRIVGNSGTNLTCSIAEPLRLVPAVETNLLWEVGGFVLQIVEPKEYAGQVLTAHFDGPLASGDPFKAFTPG